MQAQSESRPAVATTVSQEPEATDNIRAGEGLQEDRIRAREGSQEDRIRAGEGLQEDQTPGPRERLASATLAA